MNEAKTYQGSCFCGAVQFTVTGEPAGMGYCHCDSCRHWSAGPVNAFSLWKPEAVKITRGADNIGSYAKTPNSHRKWCKTCGGHLFTATTGSYFFVPRGTPHTFGNTSVEPVRLLVMITPGGMQGYFEQLGPVLFGPPNQAEITRILAQYNAEAIGPPITG